METMPRPASEGSSWSCPAAVVDEQDRYAGRTTRHVAAKTVVAMMRRMGARARVSVVLFYRIQHDLSSWQQVCC